MTDFPTLGGAFRSTLLSLQKTQRLIDQTTRNLATGLKVNSALENPQNFFSAKALNNRALDFSRRLDDVEKSIRVIEENLKGVESINKLLDLSQSNVEEELERFKKYGPLPSPPAVEITTSVPLPLDAEILGDNPAAYWKLGETSGATADNLGSLGTSVDSTYVNGPALNQAPLYTGGGVSVGFNGIDQFVAVPDSTGLNTTPQPYRSTELVFNADTTAGRQVLYEEGGTTNGLSIYIESGSVYVNGRAASLWGPANISAPIVAGQTYHVAFTFDSIAGEFIGYLDGVEIGREATSGDFPAHSNNIGIGAMSESAWFHDGAQSGDGFYFQGRISDVAVYNTTLTPTDLTSRALSTVGGGSTTITTTVIPLIQLEAHSTVLDQINQLTVDANYLGINLLREDDLTTFFNEDGSTQLLTQGRDLTSEGLGVQRFGFESEEGIKEIIDSLRLAREKVRAYTTSLTLDLNVLSTRQTFTSDSVNILSAGASDLRQADLNLEGANLLALQTRQALSVTSLSLASTSNSSILNLFT